MTTHQLFKWQFLSAEWATMEITETETRPALACTSTIATKRDQACHALKAGLPVLLKIHSAKHALPVKTKWPYSLCIRHWQGFAFVHVIGLAGVVSDWGKRVMVWLLGWSSRVWSCVWLVDQLCTQFVNKHPHVHLCHIGWRQ
jgi:hypothetical protein